MIFQLNNWLIADLFWWLDYFLWFLLCLAWQFIFLHWKFFNQSFRLQLAQISSQTDKERFEFIHLLISQTSSTTTYSFAKRTYSIVSFHPVRTISVFQARFTEFSSTNVLIIDLSISSHAIPSFSHKSLRNSSLLKTYITTKIPDSSPKSVSLSLIFGMHCL